MSLGPTLEGPDQDAEEREVRGGTDVTREIKSPFIIFRHSLVNSSGGNWDSLVAG